MKATWLLALSAILVVCCGTAQSQPAAVDRPPPNIVLIVADDLGFSDLGCYGSEIHTPNLDRLATSGLRFSQFYNAGNSCPSRAALLTGLYPHQAGVGDMMEDRMKPGYRGNLNHQCATMGEVLRQGGYQTFACGKWQVTRNTLQHEAKSNWPLQRGFEHFYAPLADAGSYIDPPTLTRENVPLRATGDFYYTEAIGQQANEYLRAAAQGSRPYFLYVAFTAPRWPLQARAEAISTYHGRYVLGWDNLRQERYRRMIELGLIRPEWQLTPRDQEVYSWDRMNDKSWQQRRMEVYAAQVDALDHGVGKILEGIEQSGTRDNTLVIFVSANGGCPEEIPLTQPLPAAQRRTRDGEPIIVGNQSGVMPGTADTLQSYGRGWAGASNTPFRLFKGAVHEGGIATPLIVCWPAVIRKPGTIVSDLGHLIDLTATCYEVAKTPYPARNAGFVLTALEGESLLPVFLGKSRQRGPLFWEHEGNRAMRDGKWKLVSHYPGDWELYNMQIDRTEMNDLAARFPVIVKDMSMSYDEWAKRVYVEPWNPPAGNSNEKP